MGFYIEPKNMDIYLQNQIYMVP